MTGRSPHLVSAAGPTGRPVSRRRHIHVPPEATKHPWCPGCRVAAQHMLARPHVQMAGCSYRMPASN